MEQGFNTGWNTIVFFQLLLETTYVLSEDFAQLFHFIIIVQCNKYTIITTLGYYGTSMLFISLAFLLPSTVQMFSSNELQQVIRILEVTISKFKLIKWIEDESYVSTWEFAIKCMLMVTEELKTRRTFHLLEEVVNSENKLYQEIQFTKESIKLSKANCQQLKKEYKDLVNKFNNELQKKNKFIDEQNTELEKLEERYGQDLEFNKVLLKCQIEENELKCELEEQKLKEHINKIRSEMEEEQEVHCEVKFYYENEIKRLNQLIHHWEERYQDIEDRKIHLHRLKENQRIQHEELEFYRNLFYSREAEIDEYLEDKERRKKEEEHELYVNKMATKIQCWWRGVMVRRCLGPFKYLLKMRNAKKRKMSIKQKTMKK